MSALWHLDSHRWPSAAEVIKQLDTEAWSQKAVPLPVPVIQASGLSYRVAHSFHALLNSYIASLEYIDITLLPTSIIALFFLFIVCYTRRKETEKWENGSASKTWKPDAGSSVAVWSQRSRTAPAAEWKMPPVGWTWDSETEGVRWGAQPRAKRVEREAETQEEDTGRRVCQETAGTGSVL